MPAVKRLGPAFSKQEVPAIRAQKYGEENREVPLDKNREVPVDKDQEVQSLFALSRRTNWQVLLLPGDSDGRSRPGVGRIANCLHRLQIPAQRDPR